MGALSAAVFLFALQFLLTAWKVELHTAFTRFFHTFHFTHIFLSAVTTSAIFYRHQQNILKTLPVGYLATLLPCSLSDLFIPYLGGLLIGAPMHLHICLIEDPWLVIGINTLGIFFGIYLQNKKEKISFVSHSAHVFVSSFASMFYLVSFGVENWLTLSVGLIVITVLAVVIPCCSSDIVIPLSFVSGIHGHEHEDEHTSCCH